MITDFPKKILFEMTHKRADGEEFVVTAKLYYTPENFDYWLVHFNAVHKDNEHKKSDRSIKEPSVSSLDHATAESWGHMRFTAVLPKQVVRDENEVEKIVNSSILEQVQSLLDRTNQNGRPLALVTSLDGWTLI
jgi:hypothetical protein